MIDEPPFPDEDDATELDTSPWPTDQADLRSTNSDGRDQAILSWWPGDGGRLIGFRRAAEILAETMLESPNHRDIDTVVYPFLNCWRHYVELQLKYLIARCQKTTGKPMQRRGGHGIFQLWRELVPLMATAEVHTEADERRSIEKIISQLSELDPDNQEFRYAERKDGTPTLAAVGSLDVRSFHTAMNGVSNFLEAIDTVLCENESLRQDAPE